MRQSWVILALLLTVLPAWGLQAIDAENVIANGNYLELNERAVVYKALPQTNGLTKYWVVSVLQNDALRTLIPMVDKDSALVPKGVLRTNLVSSNYLVQRLTTLKTSIPWFVSLTTSNSLEELANAVDNEQFDIDIVAEAVDDTSVKSDVAELKGKLATIAGEIRVAAEEVEILSQAETTLLNVSIDTLSVLSLPDQYLELFDRIDALKDSTSEYDSMVSKIKNDIATLEDVDASTKSQLLGLLSPLGPNQTLSSALSSYANTAADNAQRISTEYASLPTKTSALEAELESRLLRAAAFKSLYGEDASLKQSTNFSSLEEAATIILAVENKPNWINQNGVTQLQGAWENAVNAFNKRQYATAKELGDKAKGVVKQIMNDGIEDPQSAAQQASDSLITGIALVLGGIAAIMIIRKAWEYMKPKPMEE